MRAQHRLRLPFPDPRSDQEREHLSTWLAGALGVARQALLMSMLDDDIDECCSGGAEYAGRGLSASDLIHGTEMDDQKVEETTAWMVEGPRMETKRPSVEVELQTGGAR